MYIIRATVYYILLLYKPDLAREKTNKIYNVVRTLYISYVDVNCSSRRQWTNSTEKGNLPVADWIWCLLSYFQTWYQLLCIIICSLRILFFSISILYNINKKMIRFSWAYNEIHVLATLYITTMQRIIINVEIRSCINITHRVQTNNMMSAIFDANLFCTVNTCELRLAGSIKYYDIWARFLCRCSNIR